MRVNKYIYVKIYTFLFFSFTLLILISYPSLALTEISDCVTLSIAGETYVLTQDIINSTNSTCIDITANNVILDCQGHLIDGTDDGGSYGIRISRSSFQTTNVTIKNCTVQDWEHGIYLENVNGNRIENITAISNNGGGITLTESNSTTVTNSYLLENELLDFYFVPESESECNNILINVTGSGNRPIKYFNHSVSLSNEVLSELILCNADYSNVTNVTIIGSETKKNNWLLIAFTEHSNFTDVNSSGNVYGIVLYSSSYNTLSNAVANENYYIGIYVYGDSNTISDVVASSNNYGIYILDADSNTISDVVANYNEYGIYLYEPDSNTISNATASFNRYGFYIYSSTGSNIITASRITNSTQYGMYLYYAGNTAPNLIYNNFFNNSVNVYFGGTIYTNYWNTTRQSGKNIMGGEVVAGNFWAKPDGTGFSENCTDADQDGICDLSYDVQNDDNNCSDSSNCDYLPLATYTVLAIPTSSIFQILLQKTNSYELIYNTETKTITASVNTSQGICQTSYNMEKYLGKFTKISFSCCRNKLLKLYINSNLVNTTICGSSQIISSSTPIYIADNTSGFYFKGYMDELRISNTTLTDEEITFYNLLTLVIYNPSKTVFKAFNLIAKDVLTDRLYQREVISSIGKGIGTISALLPEGNFKVTVSSKECPIIAEYHKEIKCE